MSLFIWQTYRQTDDLAFLRANYPVMAAWARFILSYAKIGTDGKLHTNPSNAHETQWDVNDPTTDIAAMRAVLPDGRAGRSATAPRRRSGRAARRRAAETARLPTHRRGDAHPATPPSAGTGDQHVIGLSYQPAATTHNVENIGLEPVWPYGLIGDQGR